MKDLLRRMFEEQLDFLRDRQGNAVVNDSGTITIGQTPFDPVTILRTDETAYRNEYEMWISEQWWPEQERILEEVLESAPNKRRFEDLCSARRSNRLIPFVGSGMSVPSGLPVWTEFLKEIRELSSISECNLEELLEQWKYEEAAEQIAESMPRRLLDEQIEHQLRIDDLTSITGPVVFLPELFDKLVLTTNLDDLLEKLYDSQALGFSHVLRGSNIKDYRRFSTSSERILLKLHGDCRSSEDRVLTCQEYDRVYSPDSVVCNELGMVFRTYSVLFMGCSLNPDRTVKLLEDIASIDQGMSKHYAFMQHPDQNELMQAREHFLSERDIFPIWYAGDHDESIRALLAGMMKRVGLL